MKTTPEQAAPSAVSIQLHPELCEILVQLREIKAKFTRICQEVKGKGTTSCVNRINDFSDEMDGVVDEVNFTILDSIRKEVFES